LNHVLQLRDFLLLRTSLLNLNRLKNKRPTGLWPVVTECFKISNVMRLALGFGLAKAARCRRS
jgi:hypothetical protein